MIAASVAYGRLLKTLARRLGQGPLSEINGMLIVRLRPLSS